MTLWHNGEKLPTSEITYVSKYMSRGEVGITILAQFIQVVDDAD